MSKPNKGQPRQHLQDESMGARHRQWSQQTDSPKNSDAPSRREEEGKVEEEKEHNSPNVIRTMIYQLLDGVAFSIWYAVVFSQLIYMIAGNSNAMVGWISGVVGVAQVTSAIIGGIFADSTKREFFCRIASFCGFFAVDLSIAAVYYEKMSVFFAAAVMWGFYQGFNNTAVEALFADSTTTGRREKLYTHKWIIQIMSWCVGYLLNLILFLSIGNHWELWELKTIMYVGVGFHPIAMSLLWTLRDKHALGAASDHLLKKEEEDEAAKKKGGKGSKNSNASEETPLLVASSEAAKQQEAEEGVDAQQEEQEQEDDASAVSKINKRFLCFESRHAPFFMVTGDFLLALGAGMTVRFLPLFFINDFRLSPAAMVGVMLTISTTTSITAHFVKKLSRTRRMGRVKSMMLIRGLGVAGLYYLGLVQGNAEKLAPMLVVYVIRNSMMNSTMGISRTIIMDYVPKRNRAKWNAMESFSNFTWSGSAALGGYLADAHGYRYTFVITAAIHTVATLVLIPAVFLVTDKFDDKEEKEKADTEKAETEKDETA